MKFNFQTGYRRSAYIPKLLLVMKLTLVLLITAFLQTTQASYGQKITYKGSNVSFEKFFQVIESQTSFKVLYAEEMVEGITAANIDLKNVNVEDALNTFFKDKPLTYTINNNVIVIKLKSQIPNGKTEKQAITITGKVTGENAQPLPGANVVIKGTTTGTTTNAEGNYSLTVPGNDAVLVFSFIGYTNQEVPVNGQTTINVTLTASTNNLQEMVVVGYTAARKKDLTGAVSVVNIKEVQSLPSGNIMQNIQGRVPGVYIQTNGSPSATTTIRIRGTTTLGNNDPLFVIDGVPSKSGMHELNPNDIESMQVLKDAASASIYGSRAASGVVIITTKQGKQGGPRIDFSTKFSTQHYSTALDPLNTEERARVFWKANVNDKSPLSSNLYDFDWNGDYNNPVLNKIYFPEFIDAEKTMHPANTDWFKEISRRSFMQEYNLSVSNGNDRGAFLFSLGYYDNNGVVKESNTNRISARFNSNYNFFNNKLTIGENFTITNQRENAVNGLAPQILWHSLVQQSIVPVKTVNGGWGGPTSGITNRDNPLRLIEDNKQNVSNFNRALGNVYIDIQPINNLHFKSSFGVDYSLWYMRGLQKGYRTGTISGTEALINTNNRYGSNVWTNTLTYDLAVNKHKFNFLLGEENIKYMSDQFSANREGIAVQDLDYAYLSSGTGEQHTSGFGSKNALQSFFGKMDYIFNDKYLASFTLRRDGSSRFGQNNKYGNFPAVSAGWRISEEKFIKDNISFLSDLKLRASWGQNGNQDNIDDRAIYDVYQSIYATQSLFTTVQDNGTAYDLDGKDSGNLPSGFVRTLTANPDLKWETTTQTDVGLDFSLFNSGLTGSLDYYIKTTKDILTVSNPLATLGEGSQRIVNGGTIENRGFELIVGYQGNAGQFKYGVTLNGSTFKNKVLFLPTDVVNNYGGNGTDNTILGHSINSVYGYVTEGIFQNQKEIDEHATQTGAGIGRLKYKDLNHDNVINEKDQDFIAKGDPKYTYGANFDLQYKNFTLNVFFQGVTGNQIYNNSKIYTDFASIWIGSNWGGRTLNAWTPQNTSSTIPAVTLVDKNNEGRTSTYFVESGSYAKLRNVQLGYNLPVSLLQKIKVRNARVYIQGQNLVTIKGKNTSIPDPETPNEAFPIPQIYMVGLNLTF